MKLSAPTTHPLFDFMADRFGSIPRELITSAHVVINPAAMPGWVVLSLNYRGDSRNRGKPNPACPPDSASATRYLLPSDLERFGGVEALVAELKPVEPPTEGG